ncbi:hypothetical protein EXIGLDRAFT_151613 [Exidia glandulosa HHB12029]|uniref:Uncharacterized protein n=1 Tax=Exidia glandulosa HHB12029 TaxID=1314781 RepID=A0A165QD26_EXIGL|nr:hypothetical protein EXIGLDRAFT_151613 [Exidia glandulosa HHB12029]
MPLRPMSNCLSYARRRQRRMPKTTAMTTTTWTVFSVQKSTTSPITAILKTPHLQRPSHRLLSPSRLLSCAARWRPPDALCRSSPVWSSSLSRLALLAQTLNHQRFACPLASLCVDTLIGSPHPLPPSALLLVSHFRLDLPGSLLRLPLRPCQ